jgi:hypothetical protein
LKRCAATSSEQPDFDRAYSNSWRLYKEKSVEVQQCFRQVAEHYRYAGFMVTRMAPSLAVANCVSVLNKLDNNFNNNKKGFEEA